MVYIAVKNREWTINKMKKYKPSTRIKLKELVRDENIKLNEIDVSLITDMRELFYDSERKNFSGIESFNSDISDWDVSNIEGIGYIFSGARNFDGDLSKWVKQPYKNY